VRLLARLGSYSLVGVLATAVHGISLLILSEAMLPTALANTGGFLLGFLVSFTLQQRFTFQDRLQGARLSVLAGVLMFTVNLSLSYAFGALLPAALRIGLPLMPAAINFLLYNRMSSMAVFLATPHRTSLKSKDINSG
jgi:putative flippase GtrA